MLISKNRFIRLLLAILIAPATSALLITLGVFIVDFFRGSGTPQDLLGDRGVLAFLNYWTIALLWCYLITLILGMPLLFLIWISGILSLWALIIGGGLIAQVFPLLALAESGSIWSFKVLGIAVFFFFSGGAGGAIFYSILGKQKGSKKNN